MFCDGHNILVYICDGHNVLFLQVIIKVNDSDGDTRKIYDLEFFTLVKDFMSKKRKRKRKKIFLIKNEFLDIKNQYHEKYKQH